MFAFRNHTCWYYSSPAAVLHLFWLILPFTEEHQDNQHPQMSAVYSSHIISCESFSPCTFPVVFLELFYWQSWINRCSIASQSAEDRFPDVIWTFSITWLNIFNCHVLTVWIISFYFLSQNLLLSVLMNKYQFTNYWAFLLWTLEVIKIHNGDTITTSCL